VSTLTTSIGSIDWVDLATPDIEESVSFYAQLFDWEVDAATSAMGMYYVGKVGGADAAGMMQRGADVPATVPAMWSIYIRVESADTAVARARLLGATLLQQPFDIPGGARIAVLEDPAGAAFVVVSGSPGLELARNVPGSVIGCELLTRDLDAALHFYSEMFGWKADVDLESGYVTFRHDGNEVAGMMAMPAEIPAEAPSHWLPYFAVSDCEAACAAVQGLGGTLAMPLRAMSVEDADIKMAVAEDPTGAVFGMIEHVS